MLSAMPPVVVTILLRLGAEGVEPPRLSPRMTGIFTAKPVREAATMMPPGSQSPSASEDSSAHQGETRNIARRFIYGPIFLPCTFVDIRNKSVRRSVRACDPQKIARSGRLHASANAGRAISVFRDRLPPARRAAHQLRAPGEGWHRDRAEGLRGVRRGWDHSRMRQRTDLRVVGRARPHQHAQCLGGPASSPACGPHILRPVQPQPDPLSHGRITVACGLAVVRRLERRPGAAASPTWPCAR